MVMEMFDPKRCCLLCKVLETVLYVMNRLMNNSNNIYAVFPVCIEYLN